MPKRVRTKKIRSNGTCWGCGKTMTVSHYDHQPIESHQCNHCGVGYYCDTVRSGLWEPVKVHPLSEDQTREVLNLRHKVRERRKEEAKERAEVARLAREELREVTGRV